MHSKSLFVITFALFTFSACKKNDILRNNSSKVKTYSEEVSNSGGRSGDTLNISYDDNNRMVSLISLHSGTEYLYNYIANSGYVLEIKNGSQLRTYLEAYFNSNSFVDSVFQYNIGDDSTTTKYIYNSNNQIVEQKMYRYSLISGSTMFRKNSYTYNSGGNVVNICELSPSGDTSMVKTYTYMNSIATHFSFPLANFPPFFKNLPQTITIYYPSYNITSIQTLSYEFDSQNRVVREKLVNTAGNSLIKNYQYY